MSAAGFQPGRGRWNRSFTQAQLGAAGGSKQDRGIREKTDTVPLEQVGASGAPRARVRGAASDFAGLRLARSKQGQQLEIVMHARGELRRGSRQTGDECGSMGSWVCLPRPQALSLLNSILLILFKLPTAFNAAPPPHRRPFKKLHCKICDPLRSLYLREPEMRGHA